MPAVVILCSTTSAICSVLRDILYYELHCMCTTFAMLYICNVFTSYICIYVNSCMYQKLGNRMVVHSNAPVYVAIIYKCILQPKRYELSCVRLTELAPMEMRAHYTILARFASFPFLFKRRILNTWMSRSRLLFQIYNHITLVKLTKLFYVSFNISPATHRFTESILFLHKQNYPQILLTKYLLTFLHFHY